MLTVAESAADLLVPEATVWRWISEGKLPCIAAREPGGALLIRQSDLQMRTIVRRLLALPCPLADATASPHDTEEPSPPPMGAPPQEP